MKYNIVHPIRFDFRWDKSWRNNGTTFFQRKEVFDVGLVTIRLIKPKNDGGGWVVIWMPERYLGLEELDRYKEILEGYCQRVANWFMKKTGCVLGLPELYQKPEFAFPEDPDFVELARKANVSHHGTYWVDESEGVPEFETNDVRIAKVKMELPERVLALEVKYSSLLEMFSRLEEKLDQVLGLFGSASESGLSSGDDVGLRGYV